MNRTKIEWTDFTWNVVTGCWGPGGTAEKPNRCPYCYAWKISARFGGGRILSGNMKGHEHHDPFSPTFHPERLSEPAKVRKPSRIFVGSMTDLFGDWVYAQWIMRVRDVASIVAPWHTYIFLTKNPKRLQKFNPWPANCWLGTTVTNQADADERIPWLLQVDAPVRFVSHEPLLGRTDIWQYLGGGRDPIGPAYGGRGIEWGIIGAMTGPGAVKPTYEWVSELLHQYHEAKVSVFLKNNLYPPGAPSTVKIQEWPLT